MFKIKDYHRNCSGKIIITVETDDATSALMLRFLSEADKFAELFQYRLKTETRIDASQKIFPEKMAQARRSRADLLKRFREIPGSRTQRLRILKEMLAIEGIKMTLDRLIAAIQVAGEEETLRKQMQVKTLIRQGKTINDIASELSISKSTVARYAKAKGLSLKSPLTVVETFNGARPRGNRYRKND